MTETATPPRSRGRDTRRARAKGAAAKYPYIRRKLEMARDFPRESRLFANEMLQGAPHAIDVLEGELKALVASGLTPYRALRAGTINVARFFGTADRTGTDHNRYLTRLDARTADVELADCERVDDRDRVDRHVVGHGPSEELADDE